MKQGRTYANSVCSAQKPEPKRVLRAEGALRCFSKQREARADQERLRRPPGAFATWQAAGGRAPPATSPERWGRSWASRPSRCAVAARALTPIHSDSAPQAPARASGAFSSGGRVKGLVRPAAPQGRGHGPLTRPERPKPAGRVSGALFPRHPCPSAKAPAGSPEGAYKACGAGGTPCLGFQGARSPLGLAQRTKNPLPKASIFCSSSFALRLFTAPRRGPKSQRQKGNPGKPRIAGFWASQCNLPRLPCSL